MYDMYNDANKDVIAEFIRNNPEYMISLEKTASVVDNTPVLDKNELTKEAFADKDEKMFPIYSPETTSLSAMYIMAQSDEVPMHVKEAAQQASDFFGLGYDIVGYEKVASCVELSSDDFIFPEVQKLPAVDKETYETSKHSFLKVANELSAEDIIIGARRFLSKAKELGIDENSEIVKMAMLNGVDADLLTKEATEMYFDTGDSRYQELSYITKKASLSAPKDLPFYAVELTRLNQEHNISNTAEVLTKVASESNKEYVIIGSTHVPVSIIEQIPLDEFTEVLPKKDVEYINGDSDIVDTKKLQALLNTMTPHEQDIMVSFFQKYF